VRGCMCVTDGPVCCMVSLHRSKLHFHLTGFPFVLTDDDCYSHRGCATGGENTASSNRAWKLSALLWCLWRQSQCVHYHGVMWRWRATRSYFIQVFSSLNICRMNEDSLWIAIVNNIYPTFYHILYPINSTIRSKSRPIVNLFWLTTACVNF
jgi:hypothetical protein